MKAASATRTTRRRLREPAMGDHRTRRSPPALCAFAATGPVQTGVCAVDGPFGLHQIGQPVDGTDVAAVCCPRGEGAMILIVDDDPAITTLLKLSFELEGHIVVTASSGVEALDLARRVHPAAMVVDVMMPEMDGLELVRRLRANDS